LKPKIYSRDNTRQVDVRVGSEIRQTLVAPALIYWVTLNNLFDCCTSGFSSENMNNN
jgi:hypothetical protein